MVDVNIGLVFVRMFKCRSPAKSVCLFLASLKVLSNCFGIFMKESVLLILSAQLGSKRRFHIPTTICRKCLVINYNFPNGKYIFISTSCMESLCLHTHYLNHPWCDGDS